MRVITAVKGLKRCIIELFSPLLRIGLAAAQALGKRGAHVVVSSRRQANVDKAVALLQSQSIQVTGTTCNVGKGEDREQLVQMVRSRPSCSGVLRGVRAAHKLYKTKLWLFIITQLLNGCSFLHIFLLLDSIRVASGFKIIIICLASQLILCKKKKKNPMKLYLA